MTERFPLFTFSATVRDLSNCSPSRLLFVTWVLLLTALFPSLSFAEHISVLSRFSQFLSYETSSSYQAICILLHFFLPRWSMLSSAHVLLAATRYLLVFRNLTCHLFNRC